MDKGEYRRMAAELGLIIVCPDTSPRGNDVPDELTNWQMGKGASFYLDATETPWSRSLPDVHLHHRGTAGLCQPALSHGHEPPGYFRTFDGRPRRHDDRAQEPRALQELQRLCPDRRADDGGLVGRRRSRNIWAGSIHVATSTMPARWSRDGARFPEFLIDQGKADSLSRNWPAAMAVRRGSSRDRHRSDAAHARALRPLLLFHLDLHGRPSEVACGKAWVSRASAAISRRLWGPDPSDPDFSGHASWRAVLCWPSLPC